MTTTQPTAREALDALDRTQALLARIEAATRRIQERITAAPEASPWEGPRDDDRR